MKDTKSKLQALFKIAEHYENRYRIKYGAANTNITEDGSDIDMGYYSEVAPWTMDGLQKKLLRTMTFLVR